MTLSRTAAAEAIGTALLLSIVVGSGIMAERLAQGNLAIALLANSIATGAGLYALILIFAPISGAHFNPVVTAVAVLDRTMSPLKALVYVLAQCCGAFSGVAAAHAMFGLPLLQISEHVRPTIGEGFGEVIATLGLVLVISLASRFQTQAVPMAVAAFITSAYWFIYVIRKSRRDTGTCDDQYFCRNITGECTAVYRGTATWRYSGNTISPLVGWRKAQAHPVLSRLTTDG